MDNVEAGLAKLSAVNTLETAYLSGRSNGWLTTSPTLTTVSFDRCSGETGDCDSIHLFRYFEPSFLGSVNSSEHSFITLYQTPFYNIRTQSLLGETRSHELCRRYGRGSRYWDVCVSNLETKGKVYLLLVTCGVILSLIVDYRLLTCPLADVDETSICTVDRTMGFNVLLSTMHGDITYSLKNNSIARIDNVSRDREKGNVFFDSVSYLRMLDLLYGECQDSREPATDLFILTMFIFNLYRYESLIYTVILPLIQQQMVSKPESHVNASFCQESYRLTVRRSSFYIFAFFTTIIVVVCGVRLCLISRFMMKEVSRKTRLGGVVCGLIYKTNP